MFAVKHNGQLAVQYLSSFPGPVFSSAAVIALESFGQEKPPHIILHVAGRDLFYFRRSQARIP